MTETNDPADLRLDVTDVTHAYGDVSVLSGVSLTARAGTVTALLGPNGSGKTTLLSIIAELLEPDSGTITRHGDGDRLVGYVPQRPAFRPRFTVAETITFYGELVAESVDVEATLARVGLDGVADRRVEHLSGGMVRLLGLAQATVGSPPLLVLDEPASGLDPQLRRHIADAIADLADESTAVLLATHDLTATARIADAVAVLDDGAILASGGPDELCAETERETLADALDVLIDRDEAIGVRAGTGGDEA